MYYKSLSELSLYKKEIEKYDNVNFYEQWR